MRNQNLVSKQRGYKVLTTEDAKEVFLDYLNNVLKLDFQPAVFGLPEVDDRFHIWRVPLEVLALDECVSEEFLKLYVAYKAETNFVDVVPQAKGLRLTINLHFPEIDDPRRICKDVTHLGRWGNGDVEVRLDRPEDLTYVVGLVRQALDKQLGEEE